MDDRKLDKRGLNVRREVLGADYVDRAVDSASSFNTPLQQLVTTYCWGEIWTRPGLDRRTRSLLNLAMLPALRQWNEFRLHLRGAVANGCTATEIQEALLQVTIYCGVPAGVEAFQIAREVLPDLTAAEDLDQNAPVPDTGPGSDGQRAI